MLVSLVQVLWLPTCAQPERWQMALESYMGDSGLYALIRPSPGCLRRLEFELANGDLSVPLSKMKLNK